MGLGIGILLLKPNADRLRADRAALAALIDLLGSIPTPPDPVEPPVPPPDDGDNYTFGKPLTVPEGSTSVELADAIRRHFPRDQWVNAARVSYYESNHWRADAELNTLARGGGRCGVRYWYSDEVGWATTEQSVGYFQINICAHQGTVAHWRNLENNVKKAGELYAVEGWRPWRVTARLLHLPF